MLPVALLVSGVGAVLEMPGEGCTVGPGSGSPPRLPNSDISNQPSSPTASRPATTTPITMPLLFGLGGCG